MSQMQQVQIQLQDNQTMMQEKIQLQMQQMQVQMQEWMNVQMQAQMQFFFTKVKVIHVLQSSTPSLAKTSKRSTWSMIVFYKTFGF